MLFISMEDFFTQVSNLSKLTRDEELKLAREMKNNTAAREQLIHGYLPMVADCIRRAPVKLQTLQTVYSCINTLEKGVDSFDFLQDSESFTHHLSWRLRQCITRCLVEIK